MIVKDMSVEIASVEGSGTSEEPLPPYSEYSEEGSSAATAAGPSDMVRTSFNARRRT